MLMLLRRRSGLLYLLRATFGQDIAAPVPSPSAEGLTYVQVDGQFSQSGGKLNFPTQATPVWGDLGFRDPVARTRIAGRTLLTDIRFSAHSSNIEALWASSDILSNNGTSNVVHAFHGGGLFIDNGAPIATGAFTLTNGVDYRWAILLRAVGCHYIQRVAGVWTRLWVSNSGTTSPLYAQFSNQNAVGTLDNFSLTDLNPALAEDYTNRLVAPAAGATTTSTADAWIEHTISTLPSADAVRLRVRSQDASNYWRVEATSAGAISLIETVATVDTTRGSVAAVVASGHRIVVVQQGTVIKVYSGTPAAPVLRITYSSATNFQTATAVELNTLGTGGVVSEVVAWPLYPTGLPA